MAVTGPIGGGIGAQLTLRAAIAIRVRLISEHLACHHAGTRRGWPAITGDATDTALFRPLRDARGGIAGVQPDRANIEVEALSLAVEPAEIDDRVMTGLPGLLPEQRATAARSAGL